MFSRYMIWKYSSAANVIAITTVSIHINDFFIRNLPCF